MPVLESAIAEDALKGTGSVPEPQKTDTPAGASLLGDDLAGLGIGEPTSKNNDLLKMVLGGSPASIASKPQSDVYIF